MYPLIELDVRSEWVGHSLVELNLRKKHSINVVAIRRGEMVSVDINPEEKLEPWRRLCHYGFSGII